MKEFSDLTRARLSTAEEKARKEAENSLEQLKESYEAEKKSMGKLNLRVAQLEKVKEDLAFRVEEEKLSWQKSELGRKQLESRVRDYENRYGDFEAELSALRGSLKQSRRRTKELGLADFDRERQLMDDALATVRSRVQLLQGRLALQDSNQSRLEAENRSLQGDLLAVRALEEALGKLEEQRDRTERELCEYKAHIQANYVAKSELDKYKGEVDSRAKGELSQRLEQVNEYLAGQLRAREEMDQRRDDVERKLREEKERLQMSVDELRRACLDLASERDRWSSDCQHYRQLYDQEKRLRQKLTEELERLNNAEAQAAAALSLERERNRFHSTSQSLLGAGGGHVNPQQYNVYSSHQSLVSPLQPDPMLQQRLRSELDRSISKHLESEDSRFYVSKTRSNGNLSKSAAETDLSYLNYLKKKYLV